MGGCGACGVRRALVKRPKTGDALCKVREKRAERCRRRWGRWGVRWNSGWSDTALGLLCSGAPKPCVPLPPHLLGCRQECFFHVFETEVHNTIVQHGLFKPGQRVAIGASGGKGPLWRARWPRLSGER